jgi:hypothetical protein
MNEEHSLDQMSNSSPETRAEIQTFNEELFSKTNEYLATVRNDLERLHPSKAAEIESFLKSYNDRASLLKEAIETQHVHYNTGEQLNTLYNELLDDIYNGSLAFDREQTELDAAVPVEPEVPEIMDAPEEIIPTEEQVLQKELEQENLARIAQENPAEGNSVQIINHEKSMPADFEHEVSNAHSFQDIYDALIKSGHIIGTKGIYTAQEMINLIENYHNTGSEDALIQVTRTGGLRDKVFDLFQLEKPEEAPAAQPADKKPLPDRSASGPRPTIKVESSPVTKSTSSLRKKLGGLFRKLFS